MPGDLHVFVGAVAIDLQTVSGECVPDVVLNSGPVDFDGIVFLANDGVVMRREAVYQDLVTSLFKVDVVLMTESVHIDFVLFHSNPEIAICAEGINLDIAAALSNGDIVLRSQAIYVVPQREFDVIELRVRCSSPAVAPSEGTARQIGEQLEGEAPAVCAI